MKGIDRLASMLVSEKGFKRPEADELDPGPPEERHLYASDQAFAFLGVRRHWWQPTMIGLVDADELDAASIDRCAATFFRRVHAQHSLMGGSWGLLCFVFEQPATVAIVDHIRRRKRSVASQRVYMAAWTLELSSGRVVTHHGSPWGLFPGRSYLEHAIRRL